MTTRTKANVELGSRSAPRTRPLAAVLLALASLCAQGWSATADTRPNLILILADDLGYADIGCFGSEIRTPNIDSLARDGLRFTHFYNGAVCCPTRAALLTGLYSHQAGVGWMVHAGSDNRPPGPYQGYLNESCVTLAEVLRQAGYRTMMSGKWHVGESRPHWPVDRGFDRYFGLISGAANYFDVTKDKRKSIIRQMAEDDRPYNPPREGFYMTDAIADRAAGLLDEAESDRRPFFLYLAFTAPHFPLHAKPEEIAKYRGRYAGGWDNLRTARFERMKTMGVLPPETILTPRDLAIPPWDAAADRELMDLKMAIYAAQIDSMDQGIGRVLAKLRKIGRENNTIVLFLADNGGCSEMDISDRAPSFNRPPYLGGPESYESYGKAWANASNTPLRKFKRHLYEGGIATPFVIRWPGKIQAPGGFCREPSHIIDIMPSFVEAAGARYPTQLRGHDILPMEGASFLPLLRGMPRTRGPIFWELEGNRAVRLGPWKLVGAIDQPWELYNLMQDRTELHDLAATMPDRVREMEALYLAWARHCGVQDWRTVSPTLSQW